MTVTFRDPGSEEWGPQHRVTLGPMFQEPVDQAHRDSVQAVRWVNEVFQEAKERAARWEPRPSPS